MQSIFDATTREAIKRRIDTLGDHSVPLWGKMTLYQMMKHCTKWEEMALGKKIYRQSLLGLLFGKIALKNMLKDEPMKRGLPSVPSFIITGSGDSTAEKARWLELVEEYGSSQQNGFLHPFFGRLSREQAGQMAYKHADHHLRQFGA